MKILALVLSVLALIGVILPIFRSSFWWIRIFDYPQVQIAALCIISIILLFIYWGRKSKVTIILSALLFASFIYKVPQIIKYTPLTSVNAIPSANQGLKSNCIKILQSNVKMGNRKVNELIEMVHLQDPDILLLTEPDQWWQDQLSGFDTTFSYAVKEPLDNTYGMILYSKYPLVDHEVNYLVKDSIPSIFAKVALPDGSSFDLYCLHPEPPKPGTDTYERDAELLIVGKKIKKTNKPTVVVGDLNDVAWSYTSELFQRYSELLDPREGRGFYNTYNAKIPLLRYPLDHFFFSKEFGLVQISKLATIGSDHFPMMIDVCLEYHTDHSKSEEPVDGNDLENVEEKIEDGYEKK